MDIASIIGVVMGIVFMLLGIITSGGIGSVGNFLDAPSSFDGCFGIKISS